MPDLLAAKLATHLAKNTVVLRKARGLTQNDLARLSAIPRSTINHIETGQANPTLSNLVKLAQALRVSADELLSQPSLEFQFVERDQLALRVRDKGRVRIYNLLPQAISGVEMERMEVDPGGSFSGTPHLKGTREYFTCVAGKAKLVVAGTTHVLHKGDVLVFPGDERHSYQNLSHSLTTGISVVLLA